MKYIPYRDYIVIMRVYHSLALRVLFFSDKTRNTMLSSCFSIRNNWKRFLSVSFVDAILPGAFHAGLLDGNGGCWDYH